jgi:hypothetical protein
VFVINASVELSVNDEIGLAPTITKALDAISTLVTAI